MTAPERPTMDMTLLATAFVMARRGTCSRAQVGCVVALDGRILSTGYNGTPRGMAHCEHADAEPCATSVHAEANAVAFAARHGVGLDGSVLYTTLSPCVVCAKVYRNTDGLDLLLRASVAVDVLSDGQPVVQALTSDEVADLTGWNVQ